MPSIYENIFEGASKVELLSSLTSNHYPHSTVSSYPTKTRKNFMSILSDLLSLVLTVSSTGPSWLSEVYMLPRHYRKQWSQINFQLIRP